MVRLANCSSSPRATRMPIGSRSTSATGTLSSRPSSTGLATAPAPPDGFEAASASVVRTAKRQDGSSTASSADEARSIFGRSSPSTSGFALWRAAACIVRRADGRRVLALDPGAQGLGDLVESDALCRRQAVAVDARRVLVQYARRAGSLGRRTTAFDCRAGRPGGLGRRRIGAGCGGGTGARSASSSSAGSASCQTIRARAATVGELQVAARRSAAWADRPCRSRESPGSGPRARTPAARSLMIRISPAAWSGHRQGRPVQVCRPKGSGDAGTALGVAAGERRFRRSDGPPFGIGRADHLCELGGHRDEASVGVGLEDEAQRLARRCGGLRWVGGGSIRRA